MRLSICNNSSYIIGFRPFCREFYAFSEIVRILVDGGVSLKFPWDCWHPNMWWSSTNPSTMCFFFGKSKRLPQVSCHCHKAIVPCTFVYSIDHWTSLFTMVCVMNSGILRGMGSSKYEAAWLHIFAPRRKHGTAPRSPEAFWHSILVSRYWRPGSCAPHMANHNALSLLRYSVQQVLQRWFGTWILSFFHILGMSPSQFTNSYFSEGFSQPPTRLWSSRWPSLRFFRPKDQYFSEKYHQLLIRWFQFGVFTPIFRVHGAGSHTEIWNFGSGDHEGNQHLGHHPSVQAGNPDCDLQIEVRADGKGITLW